MAVILYNLYEKVAPAWHALCTHVKISGRRTICRGFSYLTVLANCGVSLWLVRPCNVLGSEQVTFVKRCRGMKVM